MIKNYDQLVEIKQYPNWSYILEYSYRILIIGSSGLGKTNALLNLINKKKNIDMILKKLYLYVKDPFEPNYQLLFNRRKKVVIKEVKIEKHSLIIHKQLMTSMKIWETLIQKRK